MASAGADGPIYLWNTEASLHNGWMAGWWLVKSVLELDKKEYVSQ